MGGNSIDVCARLALGVFLLAPMLRATENWNESARQLPRAYDVDVVVVGGTSAGVAAAIRAAESGARVFLAAPRPYLGEDICATRRLWLETGEIPQTTLASNVFTAVATPMRPMAVKRALEQALEKSGAQWLTGTYATDLLRDVGGNLAGVVIANRAGRQAVTAKVIIDATDRAWVARQAGVTFAPYPTAAPPPFERIVIGGTVRSGVGVSCVTQPFLMQTYAVYTCTLALPMAGAGFADFAAAEQLARDLTYQGGEVDASETLFQVPPDPMNGRATQTGPWPGAAATDLAVFQPLGVERLYVLGGCASISRAAAAAMLRPHQWMAVAERVGAAAAIEALHTPALREVHVALPPAGTTAGELRETLLGVRPQEHGLALIPSSDGSLPVLGTWDVVVVGGGTGGAPAGIGAGRAGARTLLLEYQAELGGVGTLGLIGQYYNGNRVGFTAEADAGFAALGSGPYVVRKAEWWRRENRAAGTEIWCGTLGVGAVVTDGTVHGVIVATPAGRGIVRARVVVDSTGNADIAAAAGAACDYTGNTIEHIGMQGAGLPSRDLGQSYVNTDYAFVDETDALDIWHLMVWGREKFKTAYDLSPFVDTRERRRILGDFTFSPMDISNRRTFPDTVVRAYSDFDSHGFTVHPFFLIWPPDRAGYTVSVPYRCLLPIGLEGILVTGLGISAQRDAMPVIRMQADVQNQGYAAGRAAATAALAGIPPRAIDVRALQQHLVDKGNLPAEVLTQIDNTPFTAAQITAALDAFGASTNYQGLAVIVAQWSDAHPGLVAQHAAATGDARLRCAHVLGMLGDPAGIDDLIAAVQGYAAWDAGWDYTGMGQYGKSQSTLDSYIMALGRSGATNGLDAILGKLALLDSTSAFSHHRAVADALCALRDPRAAAPLAALLRKAGMTGYAVTTLADARAKYLSSSTETTSRNRSLKELVMARALYRCGDAQGAGRAILQTYSRDLRGHFARFALAVLYAGPTHGDADGNGRLNAADALRVWQIAAGTSPAPAPETAAFAEADADGSGTIDEADANLILNASVGTVGP